MDFVINVIPDPLNFLVTIATTLVLFLVLRHFLFQPLSQFLEKRKQYIEGNLRDSEQKLLKAENMEKEYSSKLNEAKVEAKGIVEDARKNYSRILEEAKRDAHAEKTRILEKASQDADNIKSKAMAELKDDIIDIAIGAARDLSKQNIERKNAETFTSLKIEELSKTSWES
ncbi:MAG: F0F1 ATP synthase subunit B [Tissierellia bacterium]|nr:F0F1 ATP synthase subunit B [Tissierellia bacterium]